MEDEPEAFLGFTEEPPPREGFGPATAYAGMLHVAAPSLPSTGSVEVRMRTAPRFPLHASITAVALTLAACGSSRAPGDMNPLAHDAAQTVDGGKTGPTPTTAPGTPTSLPVTTDASAEAGAVDATSPPASDSGVATDAGTGTDAAQADATASDATTDVANDAGPAAPADGSVVSNDPFDPASCPGTPLTQAQAVELFQSGASEAIVGTYTIQMRQRSCTALTGCGAWGGTTTTIAGSLGDLGLDRALTGQVQLSVQDTTIQLGLQDSTEELPYFMGTQCSAVDGSTQTCGDYAYDYGDQWGGSGGLYPTLMPLTDQNGNNVDFTGVLTATCLRLAYAALDSNNNDVQEFVVLAPIAPGAPPPPNACPGGGTQMACGSAAAGQTTCCQAGLTTCPSSGCDCWGACD